MKKITLLLVASAALLCSGITYAQSAPQSYVGLSGGSGKFKIDCDGTTACDKTSLAFKLYGGYKFTPNFAIEGAYSHLGKYSFAAGSPTLSLRPTALSVGGAAFYEVMPKLNLVGRLGLASSKVKASLAGGSNLPDSLKSKESTTAYWGLGVGYAITPVLSLNGTLDTNRFKYAQEKSSLMTLGAGVSYGF
jgi:OmpA-OmpF porin, OOP family